MKLKANILTIPRFEVESGRTYNRTETERTCLTCKDATAAAGGSVEPAPTWPYSDACASAGHKLYRRQDVQVEERAPEEAKRARALYGQAHRDLAKVGHYCGGSVYLVPRDERAQLDAWIADTRAKCEAFNLGAVVCKVRLFVDVAEIDPATSHEETLRSIRARVDQGIGALVSALESGEASAIQEAVRETRNLASVLDNGDARQVKELAGEAAKIAKKLGQAVQFGESAVDKAREEARHGAARFRGLFGDEPVAVVSPDVADAFGLRGLPNVNVTPEGSR